MSWNYYGFRPYVSVAERRRKAEREMAKLAKKGKVIRPVQIEGRTIARTFWGKAWCDNLESYMDYANRLPRGRTYVRNGSVVHLDIRSGEIEATVSGSELYQVKISIAPAAKAKWKRALPRMRGRDWLAGRVAARALLRPRDGHHHAQGNRPLSRARGDRAEVLLPGLGDDVQTRGGGPLRGRRAAGPEPGAAVRVALRQPRGVDHASCHRHRPGRQDTRPPVPNWPRARSAPCSALSWTPRLRRPPPQPPAPAAAKARRKARRPAPRKRRAKVKRQTSR